MSCVVGRWAHVNSDLSGETHTAARGSTGTCGPMSRRLARFMTVLHHILFHDPKVSSKQLQRLVGHLAFVMMLNRTFLLILSACYSFARAEYTTPKVLWHSVVRELTHAHNLLPLCFTDICLTDSFGVFCRDSSRIGDLGKDGYSVCSGVWRLDDVRLHAD